VEELQEGPPPESSRGSRQAGYGVLGYEAARLREYNVTLLCSIDVLATQSDQAFDHLTKCCGMSFLSLTASSIIEDHGTSRQSRKMLPPPTLPPRAVTATSLMSPRSLNLSKACQDRARVSLTDTIVPRRKDTQLTFKHNPRLKALLELAPDAAARLQ
jgi:hypothetical protein